MAAGKNLKLATLWTKDGFNLNIDMWNKSSKFKIWPPKKGDFKNGSRRPDVEQYVPNSVLTDLYHMSNDIVKKDVGVGISKVYRVTDKANNNAWNNVLIYSLTKEAGPNYMYKFSLHFCQENVSFDFLFTKPEITTFTSDTPDLEKESRIVMQNFFAQFHPGFLAINAQNSVGDGGPNDGAGNSNGNGSYGSSKSESKYQGSTEEDVPY